MFILLVLCQHRRLS